MIWLLAACSGNPENNSDLRSALNESELKDPSSVQFQNVTQNANLICGELNAKNSYGAYVGFETFVFERSSKTLWLEDSDKAGDNYNHFLNLLNSCENGTELFLHHVERLNRKLDERIRETTD
jgi:hypothetical protein